MKDLNVDVVPQLEVGVRPEGVVELAGVAAAVLQPGRLYEELRHGGRARHHGGAHTATGARELDTLRLETDVIMMRVNIIEPIEISSLLDGIN